MRIVVLANDASGGGDDQAARVRALSDAFGTLGAKPEIRCVPGKDLGRVASELAKERPDVLVAAGGDGTVSAVAGALVGTGIPMGVIPLGTLNHFAKDVGISQDAAEAARVVVEGVATPMDAASVNDHAFVNNASIGLYPAAVQAREKRRKAGGGSKYGAMMVAAWGVLRRLPVSRLRLWIDGRPERVTTPFLFVGNNRYALEGFQMGKRASLSGGTLMVIVARHAGRLGILRLAGRALVGALAGDATLRIEEASTVRIEARKATLRVALDGEVVLLAPPLVFRIHPGALVVKTPGGDGA